ncbi:precorrin-2/cobalt-factor-2 C20-methyltransferase [Hydrogenispora ethanolica]|uniref:Precorrin-2/cobalt-factor-2 C20-methyltransferase n=1 Tax=Hydrogenispora ethanolica TaxID=1082276 RepID=A0A4R1S6K1_HYDET|nr:precorrin-2 C(20)-methyltransferase [Hydrogenispora ethanolica]TCL74072.1 precorrin-2/cobalt-factor-2 C20-methyltransferase [Hydrogenispora ethanolica]
MGVFYGVGLGPGDPELLSIKGLAVLKRAGRIYAPGNHGGQSLAGAIVRHHLPDAPLEYLEMPMTREREALETAWREGAGRILASLSRTDVAFVTLGDPLLYGSYLYLYREIRSADPAVVIRTIPGITGFSAVAARCNVYLTEGSDRLLLLTGTTDPLQFQWYCREFETLVIYKPGADGAGLCELFFASCPAGEGVLVSRCGMAGEAVTPLGPGRTLPPLDYFSIIILHTKGKP